MKDYFSLQHKMIIRFLEEQGITPVIGFILGFILFFGIALLLFFKTAYASYLLLWMCFSLQLTLAEKKRSDFILSIFGEQEKMKIRLIENVIVGMPFLIILMYKLAFLEATILLAGGVLIALTSRRYSFTYTIPTPFGKSPFEFVVGIRNAIYFIPVPYLLTIIAVAYDNYNLGVFSLVLLLLMSSSFYTTPEKEYFVWVFKDSPKSFLWKKIRTATTHALILVSPILLCLGFFYPGQLAWILLITLACMLFIWLIILAKYSKYPQMLNVPEGILITMCIYFPPLLLVMIPYFYKKSITGLKFILNDKN